jgi:hypothetical protein
MNEPASVLSTISLLLLVTNVILISWQFCLYPCNDPYDQASKQHYPPTRTSAPPDPSAPIFKSPSEATASAQVILAPGTTGDSPRLQERELSDQEIIGIPSDFTIPSGYNIANVAGHLSDRTAHVSDCFFPRITFLSIWHQVDAVHYNGLSMYDTRASFTYSQHVSSKIKFRTR